MPNTFVTPGSTWCTSVQPAGGVVVNGVATRPCATAAIITSPSTTPLGTLRLSAEVAAVFEATERSWIGFES